MNRPLLLTVALVLTAAAASPAVQAQTPKKPAPMTAPAPKPAPVDFLKAVRAHAAVLRVQTLTRPQASVRWPQTVPPPSWAGKPSSPPSISQSSF